MDIQLEYSSEDSDSEMDSDVEFMDIQSMKSSSDEPEGIPLLESSSDDSDSWTDGEDEFMDIPLMESSSDEPEDITT